MSKSLSFEQIYNNPKYWIDSWLTSNGYKSQGNINDRLIVTHLVSRANMLNVNDSKYLKSPEFNKMYLMSIQDMYYYINDNNPDFIYNSSDKFQIIRKYLDYAQYTDIFGFNIFEVFIKKNKANNIYDRERSRIIFLYDTKQLSNDDKNTLIVIINNFESIYNAFIDKVKTRRKFVDSNHSETQPRDIKSSTDWAEAIIELQGISFKFLQVLDANIKQYTGPEYISKVCAQTPYNECQFPCHKHKGLISLDNKCSYKQ